MLDGCGSLASLGEVQTELEKDIDRILGETGLKKLNETEKARGSDDLPSLLVSREDVLQRTQELRRMREILFYQERKNRRIKKIKSKTFRKVLKKEKEKTRAAQEAEAEDPAQKRLDQELSRAKERISQKHNNAGKWARKLLRQSELDETV